MATGLGNVAKRTGLARKSRTCGAMERGKRFEKEKAVLANIGDGSGKLFEAFFNC
jgi:hypothetical protein